MQLKLDFKQNITVNDDRTGLYFMVQSYTLTTQMYLYCDQI